MKKKKLLLSTLAVVMSLVCATAAFAGCAKDGCDHVYKERSRTDATCSQEGERELLCGICGDVVTEILPIDPDNHLYGDWEITLPTETAKGQAVKTCEYNSSHRLTVDLPVLSSTEYSKELTTAPTPLQEGVMTYTLAHEQGDIVFTQTVSATGIQTVADAVAVSTAMADKVRRAEGEVGFTYYEEGIAPIEHFDHYLYEFGDNYTYIEEDGNRTERYYSRNEDGSVCGYLLSSTGTLSQENEEDYLKGHRFALTYTKSINGYFGAEELLKEVYAQGLVSLNEDFFEKIETDENGEKTYVFGFGVVSNGDSSAYFSKVTVSFTVTEENTIGTLDLDSVVYVNNNTDLFGRKTWELGEDGIARVIEGQEEGTRYVDHIDVTQTTVAEAEAAGEEPPQNPYEGIDPFAVSSFEVWYGTKNLDENTVLDINADDNEFFLYIRKVQPSEATSYINSSTFSFWLLTEDGKETEIAYDTLLSKKVLANFEKENLRVKLRSQLTGEVTILVKTEHFTKTLKFNVKPIAPTSLNPVVWQYAKGNYSRNTTLTSATVYVGQPLWFKAAAPADYYDGSYTAAITSANAPYAALEETTKDGENATCFTATREGVYSITMQSAFEGCDLSCALEITVVAAPSMSTLLSGTYTAFLDYPNRGTVTVAFNGSSVTVTLASGETETLTYTLGDVNDLRTLSSAHASGQNLGFTLIVNEAYDLILSHSTGYGDEIETKILSKTVVSET